jgi:hypothetical protein
VIGSNQQSILWAKQPSCNGGQSVRTLSADITEQRLIKAAGGFIHGGLWEFSVGSCQLSRCIGIEAAITRSARRPSSLGSRSPRAHTTDVLLRDPGPQCRRSVCISKTMLGQRAAELRCSDGVVGTKRKDPRNRLIFLTLIFICGRPANLQLAPANFVSSCLHSAATSEYSVCNTRNESGILALGYFSAAQSRLSRKFSFGLT